MHRPNLLIIHTDEHNFRTLGCYGGKVVKTPNIDFLAARGAMCTRFYATTPVCSPSRAAFVSGRYPHNTPVVTNNIPMSDEIVTFAEILRRDGYATGYAGKWHIDGTGKPQWAPQRKFGFEDNRYMFNRGHWKKLEDTPAGPRVAARDKKNKPGYAVAGADEKSFTTDWLRPSTLSTHTGMSLSVTCSASPIRMVRTPSVLRTTRCSRQARCLFRRLFTRARSRPPDGRLRRRI
jgi:arylsulfatase A-like enzyme